MLASMTGFGDARSQSAGISVSVEVRTINNRHFKLGYRSSEGYASLEPEVENVVRQAMRRGTVQVNLRVDRQVAAENYRINAAVLENYRAQLIKIVGMTEGDHVGLETLLMLPGVVDEQGRAVIEPRDDWPIIEPVLQDALAAVNKMRLEEGKALLADLSSNAQLIEQQLDEVTKRAPAVVESYQSRLLQRVNKSLEELKVSLNATDILREVSLFVDRSDISEEIVRLRSHLQQYGEALTLEESSGRKLEFIVQEMGREVNTIGSKANDAEISKHVIEIKSALERIREQIQNVE